MNGWGIALLLAAVISLAALVVWKIGVTSQRPRWLSNEQKPNVPYEEFTFESEGSRLYAWIAVPHAGAEPVPVVVIAHGWGSNRSRVLRYAMPLYESGFAVMLFDARSHGDSEKIAAPTGIMFRDDVEAAVAAVKRQPGIDAGRVAVLGHSMGGFGALLALGRGMDVSAIITDSSPLYFDTILKAEFSRRKLPVYPLGFMITLVWLIRAGISLKEFRQVNLPSILKNNIHERNTPILLVHSLGDSFIPAHDLQSLLTQLTVPHLFVQSKGHSASETDPLFWQTVLPFLKKAFGQGQ